MAELEIKQGTDPIALFRAWMKEAEASEVNDPNAVALATAFLLTGAAVLFERRLA